MAEATTFRLAEHDDGHIDIEVSAVVIHAPGDTLHVQIGDSDVLPRVGPDGRSIIAMAGKLDVSWENIDGR